MKQANLSFFITINRKTSGVKLGLQEFLGKNLKDVGEIFFDKAKEFKSVSRELGIPNPNSVPRRPQSNSRTEARMGRVGDGIRALLLVSSLYHFLWVYAGAYYCTMRNLTHVISEGENAGKTFYEVWTGDSADGLVMYEFGAEISFVLPPSTSAKAEKFAPRGTPGIFLGYKLQPGGKWSRSYLVVPLSYFTEKVRLCVFMRLKMSNFLKT